MSYANRRGRAAVWVFWGVTLGLICLPFCIAVHDYYAEWSLLAQYGLEKAPRFYAVKLPGGVHFVPSWFYPSDFWRSMLEYRLAGWSLVSPLILVISGFLVAAVTALLKRSLVASGYALLVTMLIYLALAAGTAWSLCDPRAFVPCTEKSLLVSGVVAVIPALVAALCIGTLVWAVRAAWRRHATRT